MNSVQHQVRQKSKEQFNEQHREWKMLNLCAHTQNVQGSLSPRRWQGMLIKRLKTRGAASIIQTRHPNNDQLFLLPINIPALSHKQTQPPCSLIVTFTSHQRRPQVPWQFSHCLSLFTFAWPHASFHLWMNCASKQKVLITD